MTTAKLKMAELTSEEARQYLTDEAVILLPMGSLEDQGTHAPMGDYLGAECVALDIARAARAEGVPTFVAPPVPFGGADYFGSSHGGIAIEQATLTALINDMIASLARHGLTKVLIINGHGGNVQAINEVTQNWRRKNGMFVASMYLWQISYELLKDILGPEQAARASGHGGDPLTSIGLHYYPDILRMDLRQAPPKDRKVMGMDVAGMSAIKYDGARIQVPIEAIESAPHGVWGGDPVHASAETGRALSDRLVKIGAGFIRDHVAKGFAG
ncbi:creatininase family protein [Falsirhodobacter halotolerans]|uniref:creatininase family protein n=1 Tax=Falsirhodobacter halotolerans TaxID=1146892 RepID=UPI001FD62DF0|nr:creatininase family protein [Falsirhodobacter halotolerans]MCJ8139041.1 creatininase family protein [Falsirhodobacter halotolerans]